MSYKILKLSMFFCLILMMLLSGCKAEPELVKNTTLPTEAVTVAPTEALPTPIAYFTKDDFSTIVLEKSTWEDVYEICNYPYARASAFGADLELPMENGGHLLIRFYGPDLIVFAIEEIPPEEDIE